MSKNQVALFENELEKMAQASLEAEKGSAGITFLSTKGGILTYKDNPIAGNSLEVVVIASPVERLYYTARYDPTKPAGPVCFALGQTMTGLKPNVNSEQKQSDTCANCPKDQWGSSTTGGKGKACAEKRRLLIVTADSIGSIDAVNMAEVAALRAPVTSVKAFAVYLQKIANAVKRPLSAVVTKISLVPDPKTQFKLEFDFVREIDDVEIIKALITKGEKEMTNAVETAGIDDGETTNAVSQSTKY